MLLANLLCRLPDPLSCLSRLKGGNGLVKPEGVVVITTPFTWLDEYTHRRRTGWVRFDVTMVRSSPLDALHRVLSREFDLLEEFDTALALREHRREYQIVLPLVTVWRRKSGAFD